MRIGRDDGGMGGWGRMSRELCKSKDLGLKLSSINCSLWYFGKLLHLSKLQFPHLENRDSNFSQRCVVRIR